MRTYYKWQDIEDSHPEVAEEWDVWLSLNFDPGHYDTYKERDQTVLPYVDGKPQWVVEIYMPPHLVEKVKAKI
jgi:hypothetical protein